MQHSENTRDDSQRRCDAYSRPPVIDDLGVMMPFILGTEFCEKKRSSNYCRTHIMFKTVYF